MEISEEKDSSDEAFLVADIGQSFDVDGIIGVDSLRAHKGQVDLENDRVRYDGIWIPCYVASSADVLTAKGVTIEPGSVSSITVTLPCLDSNVSPIGLVWPLEEFQNTNALLVAQCMVDSRMGEISLTTINMGEERVDILPNQIVAHMEPLTPDDEKGVSCNAIRAGDLDKVELSEQLQDMYQRSCVQLDTDQSLRLKELLLEFVGVFAVDDDDLGRTGLVKHTINVGDAKPVKQAPRRQAIAKRQLEEAIFFYGLDSRG